jgi:predicted TIM-barrel fold metal-dependent hydrolase
MAETVLISADSHVVEPADVWTRHIGAKWRDKAPVTTVDAEGTVHWTVDSGIPVGSVGAPSQAGLRFEDPSKVTFEGKWEDVRPGCADPAPRLADMALDGVAGEVVYPTVASRLYTVIGGELLSACLRAMNDWMAEFVEGRGEIFRGVAMLNTDDPADAAGEIARIAGLGLGAAMIPTDPGEGRSYDQPGYDLLWAAAEAHGVPLSFHVASPRMGPGHVAVFATDGTGAGAAAYRATQAFWMQRSLACMIFSGVFERFPGLRVAIVEHELSWLPHLLVSMDRTYTEYSQTAPYRFAEGRLPSDFFRDRIYTTFQEDKLGVETLPAMIGDETIMWGSDYPHAESTWPNSRRFLDDILGGKEAGFQDKLTRGNVARLYGFA